MLWLRYRRKVTQRKLFDLGNAAQYDEALTAIDGVMSKPTLPKPCTPPSSKIKRAVFSERAEGCFILHAAERFSRGLLVTLSHGFT